MMKLTYHNKVYNLDDIEYCLYIRSTFAFQSFDGYNCSAVKVWMVCLSDKADDTQYILDLFRTREEADKLYDKIIEADHNWESELIIPDSEYQRDKTEEWIKKEFEKDENDVTDFRFTMERLS